ncbi:MAG: aldose 1-epimerase family protein [Flavobacteriaceae bacterium]|nr:aldose 1-epimerase family protein [Flavobacteriaceae bacterium]
MKIEDICTMNHSIENHVIRLLVNENGAEMCSLISKNTGRELLWQADQKHWPRNAPVLFPIVGRLRNDKANCQDEQINLTQHGFARDMIFELKEKTDDYFKFELNSNETTRRQYPFDFELFISYQLLDDGVKIGYEVYASDTALNKDGLWFSIGAHPGFNWPFQANEKPEDYFLEFEHPERLETILLKEGLRSGETKLIAENAMLLRLHHGLFATDALIFKNLKSRWVKIVNELTGQSVKVSIEGWPWLGIWTKPNAPFLCIEPWQGVTDSIDSLGNFEAKDGVVKLLPGEFWRAGFEVRTGD